MRHITLVSNLILLAGVLIAAAAIVFDLSPVLTLIGLMMVIAGIVKIVTIRIWSVFFVDEEGAQR